MNDAADGRTAKKYRRIAKVGTVLTMVGGLGGAGFWLREVAAGRGGAHYMTSWGISTSAIVVLGGLAVAAVVLLAAIIFSSLWEGFQLRDLKRYARKQRGRGKE